MRKGFCVNSKDRYQTDSHIKIYRSITQFKFILQQFQYYPIIYQTCPFIVLARQYEEYPSQTGPQSLKI